MDATVTPAEVWPMAFFMAEEMEARGWNAIDVAKRMPGNYASNIGVVNLLLAIHRDDLIFDAAESKNLGAAFGVNGEFFLNLHRIWLENPGVRQEWKCPDHLFAGLTFPAQ